MRKLVVATQNRNKFKEMREALTGVPWELQAAFDFPGAPEVVEDGKTLEENSLKKAREVALFTGLPSLADDTGLFVDFIDGQPGIYAARFAGENCTYGDNVRKLLGLLEKAPDESRGAVFKTVITFYHPDGSYDQVAGEVGGAITRSARGEGGFGYDPIFLPAGHSKVFAEMTLEEKNRISHRGRAVLKARELLNKMG